MEVVILLGLLAGLFAFLSRYEKTRWGLKVSFGLIFVFLALRYDYGNDYAIYLKAFEEFNQSGQYDLSDVLNNNYNFEPGWVLLNQLFRPLGFFGMTAALALVNCLVYYFFIKAYVPIRDYWIAVCLYVFDPVFMLIQLSAMRQTVAIILFIVSLNFLSKKQPIRYFLCIGLASLFHISALVLLPVYLLTLFNWNLNAVSRTILVSLFASVFVFSGLLNSFLGDFVNVFFEKYEFYRDAGKLNTGLGFVYGTGMFFLALFYGRTQNKRIGLVFNIAIISFMFIPLTLTIEMISRIGFYFAPATMVGYPLIAANLKSPITRTLLLTLLFVFTGWKFYHFIYFFENNEYYLTYQTIFSALEWY